MNKVNLVGRLTKDIEVRYTQQTNTAVGRFNLAVNRRKKEDGADFISCVAWGKTAEIMEKYVKKGHRVGISGRIQTGSYEKDGHKYYTTDVIVEDFEFLETKGEHSDDAPHESAPQEKRDEWMPIPDDLTDDDLPF